MGASSQRRFRALAAGLALVSAAMSLSACTGRPVVYGSRPGPQTYRNQQRPAAAKPAAPLSAEEKQALFERFSNRQSQQTPSD